jgi:hypothetical protein
MILTKLTTFSLKTVELGHNLKLNLLKPHNLSNLVKIYYWLVFYFVEEPFFCLNN